MEVNFHERTLLQSWREAPDDAIAQSNTLFGPMAFSFDDLYLDAVRRIARCEAAAHGTMRELRIFGISTTVTRSWVFLSSAATPKL